MSVNEQIRVSDFINETILELKDIDESELTPDLTIQDLALASLDYVEMQVLIKKKYGVEINPDLFMTGEINTLGDFVGYVEKSRLTTGR